MANENTGAAAQVAAAAAPAASAAERANTFLEKVVVAAENLINLKIVTVVGDATLSGTLERPKVEFSSDDPESDQIVIATNINIVDSDITTVIPKKYENELGGAIMKYHTDKVVQANESMNQRNRLCTWLRFDQHAVGKGFCIGGEAEERAESSVAGFAAVEAKDELIEIGLQMLATQPVVDASRPSFEVGEDLVDPRQDEVSGGLPDDMDIVAIGGDRSVAGPAVGFRDGVGIGGGFDEVSEVGGAVGGDFGQPQAAWDVPSPSSMAPTMSILPSWLRPCPPVGGSSLVRNGRLASSISTRPDNGLRSGSTMLARSLWASSQALR